MRKELYIKLRKAAIPGEKGEIIKEIVEESGLDYRTVNALVKIVNNESGITRETIDRLADRNFYTIDNMVRLAEKGLTEIIPAGFFMDDEFLLRSGIDYIPEMFLYGNDEITEFYISPHIKKIRYGAFMDCTNLRKVHFNGKITSIGRNAFKNAKSLRYIDIPDNCDFIGAEAFMGCINLTQFRIPKNTSELRQNTFKNCFNLKAVLAGKCDGRNRTIRIADGCFNNCISLEDMDIIPTQIGIGAFYGCENLGEIIVESTVIESGAFAYCRNLETIAFAGNPPKLIKPDAFTGCGNLKHVISDGFSYALRECDGYYELTKAARANIHPGTSIPTIFQFGKRVDDIVKEVPKVI